MFPLSQFHSSPAIITDKNESLTYSQLSDEVDKFYQVLPQKGLLFLLCSNRLPSFIAYVACMCKHIPAVLLDGEKDIETIRHLIDLYKPEYLWMSATTSAGIEGKTIYQYGDYVLLMPKYVSPLSEEQRQLHPDLALCLTTSGSTGSPKFVRLSLENLKSNAESIAEYLQIDNSERPVLNLPMHYSFGISVINSHLIKGATVLLTDKTVMQREFWTFFKEQKATSLSGVPYTYEMLKRLRFMQMDLPSLRTLTQAGGRLNPTLVKEYAEYAQTTNRKFIVMYGQTEASPRMSYLPADMASIKSGSIGIAIPNGKFSLINADGQEITQSEEDGELIYTGKNVCLGYAECRADLSKGDENHAILHTGDIARRDADGFYYITGRKKRFVKVWGNRCNLDAIEQLVHSITSDCACVGVDNKITIFITNSAHANSIKSLLVEKTGFHSSAFAVQTIDTIPKLSSNKIDYPALMKLL